MIKLMMFSLIMAGLIGCVSSRSVADYRAPASMTCRAQCVIEDNGTSFTLARLLGASLGELHGSTIINIKKQCQKLAADYVDQHKADLMEISPYPVGYLGITVDEVFVSQVYFPDSFKTSVDRGKTYIDPKAQVATTASSCGPTQ